MNTNEELKTRPDFEKLAKDSLVNYIKTSAKVLVFQPEESYEAGYKNCGNELWTTHVEPLQVENGAHKIYIDTLHGRVADLQSENQKLREQLELIRLAKEGKLDVPF